MTNKLVVIAAVGEWRDQKFIGESNQMPWFLPRDLRFFKLVTDGSAVIMGRKTFDSLGKRVLPNRRNIVVTRQPHYEVIGGERAGSLHEAISISRKHPYTFVIGGGQLYAQAIELADHLLITEICHRSTNEPLFEVFRGDTYFPQISEETWIPVRTSRWFKATSARSGPLLHKGHSPALYFRFIRFDRRSRGKPEDRPPDKLFFGKGRLIAKRREKTVQLVEDQPKESLPLPFDVASNPTNRAPKS